MREKYSKLTGLQAQLGSARPGCPRPSSGAAPLARGWTPAQPCRCRGRDVLLGEGERGAAPQGEQLPDGQRAPPKPRAFPDASQLKIQAGSSPQGAPVCRG